MEIRALKLQDVNYGGSWYSNVYDKWEYDDFKSDPEWKNGWISMDCAYYNKDDDRVYLGITCFNENGIFKAYDRKLDSFVDLGYEKIAKPFDAKFHRSLLKREKDGCLYGAVALLHCSDKQFEAQGGSIIRYDPKTGEMKRIATPIPHTYIQAMVLDNERDLLFCQCFPPEYLISYNLETGEVKNYGLVGTGISGMAQGENIELDEFKNLWGPWCLTRAWQPAAGVDANRIFRLNAGEDKVDFLSTGLPKKDGSLGYNKIEGIFNFNDGYMYASGANGSIYRINTKTGYAAYLFTPVEDRNSRLASMKKGPDGYAYGIVGRDGKCELLRFDYKNTKYELLGQIIDKEGTPCYQIHDLVITDDMVIYACENDVPHRSGYLWEIKL